MASSDHGAMSATWVFHGRLELGDFKMGIAKVQWDSGSPGGHPGGDASDSPACRDRVRLWDGPATGVIVSRGVRAVRRDVGRSHRRLPGDFAFRVVDCSIRNGEETRYTARPLAWGRHCSISSSDSCSAVRVRYSLSCFSRMVDESSPVCLVAGWQLVTRVKIPDRS